MFATEYSKGPCLFQRSRRWCMPWDSFLYASVRYNMITLMWILLTEWFISCIFQCCVCVIWRFVDEITRWCQQLAWIWGWLTCVPVNEETGFLIGWFVHVVWLVITSELVSCWLVYVYKLYESFLAKKFVHEVWGVVFVHYVYALYDFWLINENCMIQVYFLCS